MERAACLSIKRAGASAPATLRIGGMFDGAVHETQQYSAWELSQSEAIHVRDISPTMRRSFIRDHTEAHHGADGKEHLEPFVAVRIISDRHSPGRRLGPSWLSGPIKCGSPGFCGASCRAGLGQWPNLPLKARASQVRHEVRGAGPHYRLELVCF